MAIFKPVPPDEIIRQLEALEDNTDKMLGEMCRAGAEAVYRRVVSNMQSVFKSTGALMKGLRLSKIYHSYSDDAINVKVLFCGYDHDKTTKRYPNGVPIPLIAMAREYGTSSGESKRPFIRPSFDREEIERVMMDVQKNYIPEDNDA